MQRADPTKEVVAWAACGGMALTGRPDRPPLGPPEGLVARLRATGARLVRDVAALGGALDVDVLALLGERAAVSGFTRQGQASCGRATRLLRAADEWLAVTLARPDDRSLVPAWLELPDEPADVWAAVGAAVAARPAEQMVGRAALLGLPVAALAEARGSPIRTSVVRAGPPLRRLREVKVVDLSSLWAGPLCGELLALAGADVVKVESTSRPDGARSGPPELFDLLNAHKRSVAVDVGTVDGRRALAELVRGADIVIEASRPRALEQLGIDAEEVLATSRTSVWVSITGHGRRGAGRERVGFGDDAAVAGGLVCWHRDEPVFCADAVADPLTGITAAGAVLNTLLRGGDTLLDVSMADVAAAHAGPTLTVPSGVSAAPPRARTPTGRGPRLGADTADVLDALARRT